ncbi:MAG: hypothetical protein AB7H97_08710 [Pseudobdellovibrionaceae bacterium]
MKLILSFFLLLSFASTGIAQDTPPENNTYDSLFDESQDVPVEDTNADLSQPSPAPTGDLEKAIDPAPLEPVADPEPEQAAPPSKAKAHTKTKAKPKAKASDKKAKAKGKDKSKGKANAKAAKGKGKPKKDAKVKPKKKKKIS